MTPPIGGILRLSGHVIGRQSRQGLAGLLVEFRAGTALQPIATATTAADGAFELQFGDVALAAIPLSAAAPPPEFSIRVVSGQTAVATAKITDLPRPGVAAGPLTIEVDQDPATVAAALLNTVQGEVRDGLGTPVAGVTVIAFAKLLRSEAAVGSFTTTAAGTYSIAYPAATLHPAGLVAGALVVRAFDPAGKQIASSPLVFNPRPIETVNLAVG